MDLLVPLEGRRYSYQKISQKESNINNSKVSATETNKTTSFGKQKQTNIKTKDSRYEFIDNNAIKNIFNKFKDNI